MAVKSKAHFLHSPRSIFTSQLKGRPGNHSLDGFQFINGKDVNMKFVSALSLNSFKYEQYSVEDRTKGYKNVKRGNFKKSGSIM